MQNQSLKNRKRYYDHREELRLAKRATKHLAAAIRGMDTRLRELRSEVAALRKDVMPLWHWHGDAGWKPADPLAERIEQIEQRLSVERGIP